MNISPFDPFKDLTMLTKHLNGKKTDCEMNVQNYLQYNAISPVSRMGRLKSSRMLCFLDAFAV